ncbi:MAG: hypothetical protein ACR2MN_01400 [Acidimicrobiales bacterium]
MTDDRSPLDTALDLVLYAPIGLALTVGEEVPKLAAKGRLQLATRWATARVVGQFAVAQGRREVQRRTGGGSSGSPRPTAAPGPPAPAAVAPPGPATAPPTTSGPAAPSSSNGAGPSPSAPRSAPGVTTASRPEPPSPDPKASASAAAPAVDDLAIPGYDSLSASQVVQRLAGLAAGELEAVRTYEAATRGRRTILARVSQLQGT